MARLLREGGGRVQLLRLFAPAVVCLLMNGKGTRSGCWSACKLCCGEGEWQRFESWLAVQPCRARGEASAVLLLRHGCIGVITIVQNAAKETALATQPAAATQPIPSPSDSFCSLFQRVVGVPGGLPRVGHLCAVH